MRKKTNEMEFRPQERITAWREITENKRKATKWKHVLFSSWLHALLTSKKVHSIFFYPSPSEKEEGRRKKEIGKEEERRRRRRRKWKRRASDCFHVLIIIFCSIHLSLDNDSPSSMPLTFERTADKCIVLTVCHWSGKEANDWDANWISMIGFLNQESWYKDRLTSFFGRR